MFGPNTKILIVDDMMTMRKIVSKTCRELGFTDLTEAADGQKAWEAITSSPTPFDLIISDWNMPNCSGMDLLRRIRGDSRRKGTPFVLLTAESEGSQVSEALKAGVDNYIIKPFNRETIEKKLSETFQKVSSQKAA